VEFGDIVIATATFFVISVLFYLMPPIATIFQYVNVSFILSVLVAGLIVGVIYAHKLVTKRIKSIAKILILSAVLLAFFTASMIFTDWNTYVEAGAGHPGLASTAAEFLLGMPYWTAMQIVLSWAVGGPFAFIGLYVGSMLRKPKKS